MLLVMKPTIALITPDLRKIPSAFEASSRLLHIVEPLSTEMTWVATNCFGDENKLPKKVRWIKLHLKGRDDKPFLRRLPFLLLHQIRILFELRKLRNIDVFIFWYGGDFLLVVPFLFTTLFLKKKTILKIEGRSSVFWRRKSIKGKDKIVKVTKVIIHSIIERVMYSLAHKIAIQSEYMVERYNMQKWQHKISLANQYVDIALFKKTKEVSDRVYEVGYIGRLSAEKGVLEFAQSLPLILRGKESKAVIVGEGDLKEKIAKVLADDNIQSKVELTGWIENEKMSSYLNDVKLVVVPSYSEGVPKIVIEAMACGTPVLATAVGGIPDVIKEGETGFILEDNSPECIAANVIRVLNHPNLEEISRNGRELMERDFAYEVTVERYRKILSSVLSES